MAKQVNITPAVAYWARDPQGGWHNIPSETAAWIVGTPKGSYAKIKTRRAARTRKKQTITGEIEVAELVAMPREYKKSDIQPGVGATLWTWDLGARSCNQVRHQIDSRVREDVDRAEMFGNKPPRYVALYEVMRDRLCEGREKNPWGPRVHVHSRHEAGPGGYDRAVKAARRLARTHKSNMFVDFQASKKRWVVWSYGDEDDPRASALFYDRYHETLVEPPKVRAKGKRTNNPASVTTNASDLIRRLKF